MFFTWFLSRFCQDFVFIFVEICVAISYLIQCWCDWQIHQALETFCKIAFKFQFLWDKISSTPTSVVNFRLHFAWVFCCGIFQAMFTPSQNAEGLWRRVNVRSVGPGSADRTTLYGGTIAWHRRWTEPLRQLLTRACWWTQPNCASSSFEGNTRAKKKCVCYLRLSWGTVVSSKLLLRRHILSLRIRTVKTMDGLFYGFECSFIGMVVVTDVFNCLEGFVLLEILRSMQVNCWKPLSFTVCLSLLTQSLAGVLTTDV